jgi:hypothetical protein
LAALLSAARDVFCLTATSRFSSARGHAKVYGDTCCDYCDYYHRDQHISVHDLYIEGRL